MKYQRVAFKRKPGAPWEYGIAKLSVGNDFGTYDVEYAIDADGKKVRAPVYDYCLQDGPLCYMEVPDGAV